MSSAAPFGTADVRLLFVTRAVRLFAYGFLALILWLYLAALHFTAERIGLLLTMTLLGDVAVSLWITTTADRVGRKRMLIVGAILMALAGAVFLSTDDFYLMLAAATIGVISPSGNEVGPFLAIEQAALAQVVTSEQRTHVFAWYNLTGSLATAFGALLCGQLVQFLQEYGYTPLQSYRVVLWYYAGTGVLLALLFTRLSRTSEVAAEVAGGRRTASTGLPRFASIARRGAAVVGVVRSRRLRGRLRVADHHGLLVSAALSRRPGHTRRHLLGRQLPRRLLRPRRRLHRQAHRPPQHDDFHARAVQSLVDSGAFHADSMVGGWRLIVTICDLTNGRSRASVLHPCRCPARRALRRGRRDGRGARPARRCRRPSSACLSPIRCSRERRSWRRAYLSWSMTVCFIGVSARPLLRKTRRVKR